MKSYWFVDLEDWSGLVQIILSRELIPGVTIERGMLCTATGELVSSRSGELSIHAHTLSTKPYGRPDLRGISAGRLSALSPGSTTHRTLLYRSAALQEMRTFLYGDGFSEVDTGYVLREPFAGSAKSLTAFADSIAQEVYFRGTIEFGLKRLITAGWPKVFEIGMCGRNESAQLLEYAMLEAMWANAKTHQMLDLMKELTSRLAAVAGRVGLGSSQGREQLEQPWVVVPFRDVVARLLKIDPWVQPRPTVVRAFEEHGFVLDQHSEEWERRLAVAGYSLLRLRARELPGPTFVGDFPKSISPLAAERSGDEFNEYPTADRGYGFLAGWRIFEVVEEDMHWHSLSTSFANQNAAGVSHLGDSRSVELESYLAHGAPATSGLGFNINRFVGVISGSDRLEDITFFPLQRGRMPR